MVAPHCSWPSAQRVGRELAFQGGKIKADVKRAAVFRTDGLRTRRVDVISTLGALKVCDLGHESSLANATGGTASRPRESRSASGSPGWAVGRWRTDCKRTADCKPC